MKKIETDVLSAIMSSGKRGMSAAEVGRVVGISGTAARESLKSLERSGEVVFKKGMNYSVDFVGLIPAEIVKLSTKFAFAKNMETGNEYFIPGRFTLGAMAGDKVLLDIIDEEGRNPTGQVIKITEAIESQFLGCIEQDGYRLCVNPMTSKNNILFTVQKGTDMSAKPGDRVLARISSRGHRHSEHVVEILKIYGQGENPREISKSILEESNIIKAFPVDALRQGKETETRGITDDEIKGRTDLRDLPIFTIDGADTKDIDDAVSVEKNGDEYILGVHIADVSHYVKTGTAIDIQAYARGTSIYYADDVIPMIPKQLSNGICSLNPQVDRLAFSAMMNITADGEIRAYRFEKTIIRSRVKGVYSEINSILDGDITPEIGEKYKEILGSISLMKDLFLILEKAMKDRGCPEIDTPEAKIITDENGEVLDIVLRDRGMSEKMIEQFMLCANESAANFGRVNKLPIMYRVHDKPEADRVETLTQMMKQLGLPTKMLHPGLVSGDLQQAILASRDTKYARVINYQVLRTMAKATYSPEPRGHFSLALDDYCHFTSPIRRYPDLFTHRVLSSFIKGNPNGVIVKKYAKRCAEAANQSSTREVKAMEIERRCDDIYKASFMKKHVGEVIEATVSTIAPHGIYVSMDNSVEGLVRIDDPSLRDAKFIISYTDPHSRKTYDMGDRVMVKLVRVDVEMGQLTFEFAE